jgi:hypothetical protein
MLLLKTARYIARFRIIENIYYKAAFLCIIFIVLKRIGVNMEDDWSVSKEKMELWDEQTLNHSKGIKLVIYKYTRPSDKKYKRYEAGLAIFGCDKCRGLNSFYNMDSFRTLKEARDNLKEKAVGFYSYFDHAVKKRGK